MDEISINTINRFKANKGIKYVRARKFVTERFWKRTKNVALHVQSRSENEYDHSDICVPDEVLPRRMQTWLNHEEIAEYNSYLQLRTYLAEKRVQERHEEELKTNALQEAYPLGAGW